MRIISKTALLKFCQKNSQPQSVLELWYQVAKKANAKNFSELKMCFGSADVVGKYTAFDVGGNKYRIIAVIHYNTQTLYIRHVFTHAEYDKWTKEQRSK